MEKNIDPFFEVTKSKKFKEYNEKSQLRIKIAEAIYELRQSNQLSQEELAKLIGTTPKIISSIENAEINPE
jgi:ribosome-binding protein aMBF1 (putative translation factor)